jgi:hypothetical protein
MIATQPNQATSVALISWPWPAAQRVVASPGPSRLSRRAGALRWIDAATEKAPTDRGLKVTKGEAPSRRLLAGRKTHDARYRRFRQFIGTLRGGKPSVFW